jgi:hypothetical protein
LHTGLLIIRARVGLLTAAVPHGSLQSTRLPYSILSLGSTVSLFALLLLRVEIAEVVVLGVVGMFLS